ncbi:glycerol-3-phosphate dehydrogenase [Roseixanthobacter glucoisosaccharinicivorans]|uniref:glycerol-3-phosphate dehydrogenase n=1 Tax=Roseixanthobacter glucoisosaccharinicivorans TaxID=3119923 RepID=UPI003726C6C9
MEEANAPFDVAVIGGGINGCGIARDAAGRGASVVLFEQGDLASGTSCASTKLIHGGLRYLEHYEFRLVREALMEREILWGLAPHIIWPLRFVLPYLPGLRPAWMLRLGLFLYDHLGGRKLLPPSRMLNLTRDPAGAPLRSALTRAFEYSDCWVEDSRLVVLNALDAQERGADIRPGTRVVGAARADGLWVIETERGGVRERVRARALVNAGGPWVSHVLDTLNLHERAHVRLVQGSHIVVPRLFDHDRCYIFQNADGRIIFAIPYEGDFTLIGTTDQDYAGAPEDVHASEPEIAYLCAAASEYFTTPVSPKDVVWSYSGVRPLYDDGATKAQEATRDYVLVLDAPHGEAPVLSVFGGKITTYRRLAESALAKLHAHLPTPARDARPWTAHPWTATAPLPGGDFEKTRFDALVGDLARRHPALDPALLRRLARAYGTRADRLLEGVATPADLGSCFGANLHAREVDYLMDAEWACCAADILWRRSKLGLRVSAEQAGALEDYMLARREA